MRAKLKVITGWTAVAITIFFAGLWAFWGAFENFHEGWYHPSLLDNIIMMVFQYLLITLVFIILAVTMLKNKTAGLFLHIGFGIFLLWLLFRASFNILGYLILIPFAILCVLYYFGEPKPKTLAYFLIIFIPLGIFTVISIPQGIRVSGRYNDGYLGERTVEGNGIALVWAPRGPGWPDSGMSWKDAMDNCRYLSKDGTYLADEEKNIWRLPTVEEAVRSMTRNGENAGGVWFLQEEKAEYNIRPDKESPLWDLHSKIIYYWTADTAKNDENSAYMIVYSGSVRTRPKETNQGYLGFRAVRAIETDTP